MDLTPFKQVLQTRCGLLFEAAKATILERGIRSRMSQRGLVSDTAYLDCMLHDHDEFLDLIQLLTIKETYFFRESRHLRIVSDNLLPQLLRTKNPGEKVRILSAGCATGEEPYSLAIALMEKYGVGVGHYCSVIAVDVDREAIGTAREGVYRRHAFRNFDRRLQEEYFQEIRPNNYQITHTVQDIVDFQHLNLLNNSYPPFLQGMDIIFYRNVALHLDAVARRSIFHNLSRLLNPHGYLFMSAAEVPSHNMSLLSLVEIDGSFVYHKAEPLDAEAPGTRSTALATGSIAPDVEDTQPEESCKPCKPSESKEETASLFEKALQLTQTKQYVEARDTIERLIQQEPSFIQAYTLQASILLNMGRVDEAKERCLHVLAMDEWCLEGYILLGLIAKQDHKHAEAQRKFKEAIYIQPSCWLAHYYLADVYQAGGALERALREYEIVEKLVADQRLSEPALSWFTFAYTAEQVIHLCQQMRETLQRRFGHGI